MPGPIVPPGGFAGFAQQTPAVQQLLRKKKTVRKKRAKKKPATRGARTAKKRPAKKRAATRAPKGRLVKGSAAAKRRMAQLRKMRKT